LPGSCGGRDRDDGRRFTALYAHHFAFVEDALNAFDATILVDERRR
jgi:hypothetical protein